MPTTDNVTIQIKRSGANASPPANSLANGELAYSFESNTMFLGGPGNTILQLFSNVTGGGSVTNVATGIGLTGGPITSTGTISANIANGTTQGVTKLIDSISSSDVSNAATANAVSWAFDSANTNALAAYAQANAAYAQANLAYTEANTVTNYLPLKGGTTTGPINVAMGAMSNGYMAIGGFSNTYPYIKWYAQQAGTDDKIWLAYADPNNNWIAWHASPDTDDNGGDEFMKWTRSGHTVTAMMYGSTGSQPLHTFNGNVVSGNISIQGLANISTANIVGLISPNTTTYANGTVVVASANQNFNNTASVNVSATANGTQANLAFSANLSYLGNNLPYLSLTGGTLTGNLILKSGFAASIQQVTLTGFSQGNTVANGTFIDVESASLNQAVTLPVPVANGEIHWISNNSGFNIYLFPNSGASIDGGGANVQIAIPNGFSLGVIWDGSDWDTFQDLVSGGYGTIQTYHSQGTISVYAVGIKANANGNATPPTGAVTQLNPLASNAAVDLLIAGANSSGIVGAGGAVVGFVQIDATGSAIIPQGISVGNNYGLSGQILTSGGANANATWSSNVSNIAAAYSQANNAYAQANLAYTAANSAQTEANTVYGQANAAYLKANASYVLANQALVTALPAAYAIPNINSALGTTNTTFGTVNTQITIAQNTVAIYANGTLTQGNSNVNFNNTATINVSTSANGASQVNVAFTANANALIASANQSNISTVVEANGQIQIDTRLAPGGGGGGGAIFTNGALVLGMSNANINFDNSATVTWTVVANGTTQVNVTATSLGSADGNNYEADVLANGTLVQANSNLNFNNTATVNVAITANGAGQVNIAFAANGTALGIPAINTALGTMNTNFASDNAAWANANTNINAAFLKANAAYVLANQGFVIGTQGFINANLAYGQANLAYTAANSAQTEANTVYAQANAAYAQANTQGTYANGTVVVSNTSNINWNNTATLNVSVTANGTQSNVAWSVNTTAIGLPAINSAFGTTNTTFGTTNTTFGTINTTFATLNTEISNLNTAAGTINTAIGAANANINTALLKANAAYMLANQGFVIGTQGFINANLAYGQANLAYSQANSQGTYANGTAVVANTSNINWNNTATLNVSVTANGPQSNVAWSANISQLSINIAPMINPLWYAVCAAS